MLSGDGRYVIVFNGEIYNFLELRRELEAMGRSFRTQSDTEVILEAWRVWQEGMLPRFNGMWALAIFDTETSDLFLARDRFGIKPLLYALTPERLVFASEQRALVQSGLFATSIDIEVARQAHARRLRRRGQRAHPLPRSAPVAGWTFACGCGRDGSTSGAGGTRSIICRRCRRPRPSRSNIFASCFRMPLRLRMRSDVPIGTCLSGGFDSTAVLCTMAEHEKGGMGPRDNTAWRHAFVATFPGASNDERPMAEQAAAWAKVDPTFLEIGRDDALADLERILADTDDVYIGPPSPVWLIYRELRRQRVVVSLDGHGADELMGAYRQEGQSAAFRLRNALAGFSSGSEWARRGVDLLRVLMIKRQGHYFLRGGLRDIPAPVSACWRRRHAAAGLGFIEQTPLPNVSWHRAAHDPAKFRSYLDGPRHRSADAVHGLAAGDLYDGLAGNEQVVRRLYQAHRAPGPGRVHAGDHTLGRRKVGFNSPMPEWLNGPLSGWIAGLLDRKVPAFAELVDEQETARCGRSIDGVKGMGLGVGRADLAVSQHEMDAGKAVICWVEH